MAAEEDTQLQALVKEGFPSTRGTEARMSAYLELNDLLRVEDTEASVRQLQRCVPMLLREFRHDLQHATEPDLLHVSLRTLSYFMYHQSLSVVFTDAQVSAFLSDILTRLCATQDEVRSCVRWSRPVASLDTLSLSAAHVQAVSLVPHHAELWRVATESAAAYCGGVGASHREPIPVATHRAASTQRPADAHDQVLEDHSDRH